MTAALRFAQQRDPSCNIKGDCETHVYILQKYGPYLMLLAYLTRETHSSPAKGNTA